MKNKLTLTEIVDLSEKDPTRSIWCVSDDGKKDFILTAKDIKDSVGTLDWAGVTFFYLQEPEEQEPEEDKSTIKIPKRGIKSRVVTECQILEATNPDEMEAEINKVLSYDEIEIVDIKYSVIEDGADLLYSTLIVYKIVELID